MHHHGFAVNPGAQQRLDFLGPDHFLQDRIVIGAHDQPVLRVLLQAQPSVP
jgi:hypothetical protein